MLVTVVIATATIFATGRNAGVAAQAAKPLSD